MSETEKLQESEKLEEKTVTYNGKVLKESEFRKKTEKLKPGTRLVEVGPGNFKLEIRG
jgi:hypothetical protein